MSSFRGRFGARPTVRCKNRCAGSDSPRLLASGYAPKAYRAARFANAKPRSARHLGLFRSSFGLLGMGTMSAKPKSPRSARLSKQQSVTSTMHRPRRRTPYAPPPSASATAVSQTSAAAAETSAQTASAVTPSVSALAVAVPAVLAAIPASASASSSSRGWSASTTSGRFNTTQLMTRMHAMGIMARMRSGCHKPNSRSAGFHSGRLIPVRSGMESSDHRYMSANPPAMTLPVLANTERSPGHTSVSRNARSSAACSRSSLDSATIHSARGTSRFESTASAGRSQPGTAGSTTFARRPRRAAAAFADAYAAAATSSAVPPFADADAYAAASSAAPPRASASSPRSNVAGGGGSSSSAASSLTNPGGSPPPPTARSASSSSSSVGVIRA